jgi:hypothetical protein
MIFKTFYDLASEDSPIQFLSGAGEAAQPYFLTSSRFYDLQEHRDDWAFATIGDWDGEGARALTPDVIKLAQKFLDSYCHSSPVEVGPGIDGSLSFVWELGESYCYLDVGPDDTVHLYYDNTKGKWEGVARATEPSLVPHLDKAFSPFKAPQVDWNEVKELVLDLGGPFPADVFVPNDSASAFRVEGAANSNVPPENWRRFA